MHVRSLRWVATPLAAVLAIIGTAMLLTLISHALRATVPWSILDSVAPADIRAGIYGATVAGMTILAGCRMAPSRRSIVALVVFLVGGRLAWQELRHWYFPEGDPKAYQESTLPLTLTLLGGVATLAAVSWYEFSRRIRARGPIARRRSN